MCGLERRKANHERLKAARNSETDLRLTDEVIDVPGLLMEVTHVR
jgi:hypothetical protein